MARTLPNQLNREELINGNTHGKELNKIPFYLQRDKKESPRDQKKGKGEIPESRRRWEHAEIPLPR